MTNISLFDNDLFASKASRCETNHFHIVLESKLRWPFCINDRKTQGVFMHEYVHYLQHLSTLCGITLSRNYNRVFVEYREYFKNHSILQLPILLRQINPQVEEFICYFNRIKGSREYSNRVDRIRVNLEDIAHARAENTAVNLTAYNCETNEWDNLNHISVGYYAIIESMADMVQRLYDPQIEHNEVPYQIVQRICENEYPEICTDYKMMIAICTCALMYSNPGVGLFDAINYAKERRDLNGYDLYHSFVEENSVRMKNGKEMTILNFFGEQLCSYKQTLDLVFDGQLGYYGKVVDNALACAKTGRNYLLALLYDERVSRSHYFKSLSNLYGYPLIESYNKVLCPGGKKSDMDVALSFGFEILYKRFASVNSTECSRADQCRRDKKYSYECKFDQWKHEGLCPFTAAMRAFGLMDKKIEQNIV